MAYGIIIIYSCMYNVVELYILSVASLTVKLCVHVPTMCTIEF